jgi:hypothetical protein
MAGNPLQRDAGAELINRRSCRSSKIAELPMLLAGERIFGSLWREDTQRRVDASRLSAGWPAPK